MDRDYQLTERKLVPLVGRIVVDMTAIESILVQVTEKTIDPKKKKNFRDLVAEYKRVIMNYYPAKSDKARVLKVIRKIEKEFKIIRDLVAHNSLSYQFLIGEDGELQEQGWKIVNEERGLEETLESLRHKVKEFKKIKNEFKKISRPYFEEQVRIVMARINKQEAAMT
jgi:hypothetical protein